MDEDGPNSESSTRQLMPGGGLHHVSLTVAPLAHPLTHQHSHRLTHPIPPLVAPRLQPTVGVFNNRARPHQYSKPGQMGMGAGVSE